MTITNNKKGRNMVIFHNLYVDGTKPISYRGSMDILKEKVSDVIISQNRLYVLEAENFEIGSMDISMQDISFYLNITNLSWKHRYFEA
jgi:hypothetical protein